MATIPQPTTELHAHHKALANVNAAIVRVLVEKLHSQLTPKSEYRRGTQVFGSESVMNLAASRAELQQETAKIIDEILEEIEATGCKNWSPAEMPDVGGVAHWSRTTDEATGLSLRTVVAFNAFLGRSTIRFEVALN